MLAAETSVTTLVLALSQVKLCASVVKGIQTHVIGVKVYNERQKKKAHVESFNPEEFKLLNGLISRCLSQQQRQRYVHYSGI